MFRTEKDIKEKEDIEELERIINLSELDLEKEKLHINNKCYFAYSLLRNTKDNTKTKSLMKYIEKIVWPNRFCWEWIKFHISFDYFMYECIEICVKLGKRKYGEKLYNKIIKSNKYKFKKRKMFGFGLNRSEYEKCKYDYKPCKNLLFPSKSSTDNLKIIDFQTSLEQASFGNFEITDDIYDVIKDMTKFKFWKNHVKDPKEFIIQVFKMKDYKDISICLSSHLKDDFLENPEQHMKNFIEENYNSIYSLKSIEFEKEENNYIRMKIIVQDCEIKPLKPQINVILNCPIKK